MLREESALPGSKRDFPVANATVCPATDRCAQKSPVVPSASTLISSAVARAEKATHGFRRPFPAPLQSFSCRRLRTLTKGLSFAAHQKGRRKKKDVRNQTDEEGLPFQHYRLPLLRATLFPDYHSVPSRAISFHTITDVLLEGLGAWMR